MQVPTTTSRPAEGDRDHKHPGLRRALVTSSVGRALEYYDFAIYGTASALVFKHLFFPGLGPAVGPAPVPPRPRVRGRHPCDSTEQHTESRRKRRRRR